MLVFTSIYFWNIGEEEDRHSLVVFFIEIASFPLVSPSLRLARCMNGILNSYPNRTSDADCIIITSIPWLPSWLWLCLCLCTYSSADSTYQLYFVWWHGWRIDVMPEMDLLLSSTSTTTSGPLLGNSIAEYETQRKLSPNSLFHALPLGDFNIQTYHEVMNE